jgi:hypothetical protein
VKKKGKYLWPVLALLMIAAGCALDQRKIVIRQEEVASQNDSEWKITKRP